MSETDRPLIEGALAYVEGREEAAQNALAALEPRVLPPTLGAQLALVQSALVVRKSAAKSDELPKREMAILAPLSRLASWILALT